MSEAGSYAGKGGSFPNQKFLEALKIDPQAIITHGYKSCTRRSYLIRFDWRHVESPDERLSTFAHSGVVCHDKRKCRELFRSLTSLVKNETTEANTVCGLDFGLTFAGLVQLGVKRGLMDVFRRKSPAFTDNAAIRAPFHLGDTGPSDVSEWNRIYQDDSPAGGIHLAIIAHFPWKLEPSEGGFPSEDDQAILGFEKKLCIAAMLSDSLSFNHVLPLKGTWVEVAIPASINGFEHFGFRDGLTSPVYRKKAAQSKTNATDNVHALGEILLGHARNDGDNLYGELDIPRRANPHIDLQPDQEHDKSLSFFLNSSFAALRKIEQDVDAFEAWVQKSAVSNFLINQQITADTTATDPYKSSKLWIKSKMLGRTPNGKMLKSDMNFVAVSANPMIDKKDEAHGFHRRDDQGAIDEGDDSDGLGCPFSSHIRRMNPRDDPVTPFIHRPLLRRGMTYTQGDSKGLLGLFFCADLVEQFEHLIGAWAQGRVMGIPDESHCRDPLIGNHEPQCNRFVLPSHDGMPPRNITLKFDTPFVRTRGCAYLWFPSISTLSNLPDYFEKLVYGRD
jgi:deferrochelatase/peroxidase EfeB